MQKLLAWRSVWNPEQPGAGVLPVPDMLLVTRNGATAQKPARGLLVSYSRQLRNPQVFGQLWPIS